MVFLSNQKLLAIHHIGARGETQAFPKIDAFEADIVNVLYDADPQCIPELQTLHAGRKAKVLIVPCCVSGESGQRSFFHSAHGYCSSLIPGSSAYPDLYVSENWIDYDYVVREAACTTHVSEYDTATLDDLIATQDIPSPDFFSLDTQGSELEILRGSPQALFSTLGLVSEAEFLPLYQDQPLSGELTEFLLNSGFILCKQFPALHGSPYRAPLGLRGEQIPVTADFLFLRDPEMLIDHPGEPNEKWLRLKKLAFIALVFGFFEHALWALKVAKRLDIDPELHSSQVAAWLAFVSEFERITYAFPQLYPDGYAIRHRNDSPTENKQLFIQTVRGRTGSIETCISSIVALFHQYGMDNLSAILSEKYAADVSRLGIPAGNQLGVTQNSSNATITLPEPNDSPRYGAVWTSPADTLAGIFRAYPDHLEAFRQALSKGFFSQYTSLQNRSYIEALVDWQLELLAPILGSRLEHLPEALDEQCHLPTQLIVGRHGRILSPDLLRNLWYALFLCDGESPRLPETAQNILEIGCGYGSLARCLKSLRPQATIWLLDLPESLACTAVYLQQAFPGRRIVYIERPDQFPDADGETADFILLPVDHASYLHGRQFDLALNIWSFGEMPNSWIRQWFDLLQEQCRVDRLYLINAFLPPVTHESASRCLQGDWLLNLDEAWEVPYMEINPPIHRCPMMRNFYTGLALYCERRYDRERIKEMAEQAHLQAQEVLQEDWAQIVISNESVSDLGRPETHLGAASLALSDFKNWNVSKLLEITEYIGLPQIESGLKGPLFRLLNDFRCNSSFPSGFLLAAYLSLVSKAEPSRRSPKEIVFILGRLPRGTMQAEFAPLMGGGSADTDNGADRYYAKGVEMVRLGELDRGSYYFRAALRVSARHIAAAQSLCDMYTHDNRLADACAVARRAAMIYLNEQVRKQLIGCLSNYAYELAASGSYGEMLGIAGEMKALGANVEAQAITDFLSESGDRT